MRRLRQPAYFSTPHSLGEARVKVANATVGQWDGAPFVHCHAAWIELGSRERLAPERLKDTNLDYGPAAGTRAAAAAGDVRWALTLGW